MAASAGVYGVIDTTQNHINYPDSKWDNIRNNMGSSTTTPTTTTSAPASSSTTGTGTGSGACASVAAWSSSAVYTAGMTATYNGALWTAQWWTQGKFTRFSIPSVIEFNTIQATLPEAQLAFGFKPARVRYYALISYFCLGLSANSILLRVSGRLHNIICASQFIYVYIKQK